MSQPNLGGAPEGNQNAKKGKIVYDGLRRALARDDWRRFNAGCDKVADAFANAEPWAVAFVADRMDGKPQQSIEHSGDAENPVRLLIQNRA